MPDAVPALFVAVVLFALGMLVSATLIDGSGSIAMSAAASIVGYLLYWGVLSVTGFGRRVVPTITSLIACGSILVIVMVVGYVALTPIVGNTVATLYAWLILLWSVPVKGHIIARAIEQHWAVGIAISLAIYLLQRVAYASMTAPTH